jgi:putative ATPase
MIAGGEDIKFIARRMLILAAEDIGLANPNALVIANNCFQAVNVIGNPEASIILSETAYIWRFLLRVILHIWLLMKLWHW